MNMHVVELLVASLLLSAFHASANPDKVLITTQKKRSDMEPVRVSEARVSGHGAKDKSSEKDYIEVKLENQTFAELAQLKIDYIIFVERQKLGKKLDQPDTVDRLAGSKMVDVLTNREPKTVTTKEFTLARQNLAGGFSYVNGGRIKAEDSVVGVWVRVSQGGELIGEYANPPTVTKRGWEDK